MTTLNFDDNNINATRTIRHMANADFDEYDDRLDFDAALERRGIDADLARAITELGEDEAAQIYDEESDDLHADRDEDEASW